MLGLALDFSKSSAIANNRARGLEDRKWCALDFEVSGAWTEVAGEEEVHEASGILIDIVDGRWSCAGWWREVHW